VWIDLHQHYAHERHERLMREAERERLAATLRTDRRCWRLRLGRLQLSWNCAVVARNPC
jgi:hypothetical protein